MKTSKKIKEDKKNSTKAKDNTINSASGESKKQSSSPSADKNNSLILEEDNLDNDKLTSPGNLHLALKKHEDAKQKTEERSIQLKVINKEQQQVESRENELDKPDTHIISVIDAAKNKNSALLRVLLLDLGLVSIKIEKEKYERQVSDLNDKEFQLRMEIECLNAQIKLLKDYSTHQDQSTSDNLQKIFNKAMKDWLGSQCTLVREYLPKSETKYFWNGEHRLKLITKDESVIMNNRVLYLARKEKILCDIENNQRITIPKETNFAAEIKDIGYELRKKEENLKTIQKEKDA